MKSAKLGQIAKINPRLPRELASQTSRTVHFVPMAELSEQGFVSPNRTRRLDEVMKGYTYFENGDVLVAKITPCMENGKAALVRGLEHQIAFGSTEFHVLRPNEEIDGKYLFYMVWNPVFRHQAEIKMTGSAGQKRVPTSFLEQFEIPLPNLEEQKRIAAILDKADSVRRQQQEALREAQSLGMAIFLEMFGDISINDRDWEMVTVADAGDVQLGRQRAPKYQSGKHTHPYMRVANVFEDRIDLGDVLSMDFDASDFERYKLEDGDVLLNEGQSTELVGRPAIWRNELPDCCFQNTLVRFRVYPEKTEPEYALCVFLRYLHSSKFAGVSSKTSSVAHLGAARFARMPFPLPPLKLQTEFTKRRVVQRRLTEKLEKRAIEAVQLFNSLVQRAFKGEL